MNKSPLELRSVIISTFLFVAEEGSSALQCYDEVFIIPVISKFLIVSIMNNHLQSIPIYLENCPKKSTHFKTSK